MNPLKKIYILNIIKCYNEVMNKFILLILAAAFILPVQAEEQDYGFTIPEWGDFAPSAYVNVEEPKGLGKLNEIASYWYKRKTDFEAGLEECKALETNDERFTCYDQLKVQQYKENSDYNAKMEAQQRAGSNIKEMNSMQDNMLPINNYINSFTRFQPNEIR